MIQVLYGDEPYGIEKRKKNVLKGLTVPQMNYEVRQGSFDLDTQTACRTCPFLDEKRVVLLDIEGLKALDTPEFKEYLKAPSKSTDLLIIARSVDQRLKIFKTLKDKGCLVPCMKLKDEKDIKNVLFSEIKQRDGRITEVALAEFLKRINYQSEGVNLLTAIGFIETLCSIDKDITVDNVKRYVPSNEEANEFILSRLILDGDADKLYQQISLIPNDEDIKVLSLILKDYRIAYKLKHFNEKQLGGGFLGSAKEFMKLSENTLLEGMEIITSGIFDIKVGNLPKEYALKTVCSKLLTNK